MKSISIVALMGAATLGLSACDVEQTEEGEAPEVDIDAGSLPEYDVDTADVDVGTEEQTIEVPTIDVDEADAGAPGEGQ